MMNPDLEKLIELEKTDREMARLTEEISALPKRVAIIEGKLSEAIGAVEKAKAAIKSKEGARRQLEAEIQTVQQKIIKYREQSSSVKTNDEYRALMHEIEFSEKQVSEREDKILELMIAVDADEKSLKTAEAEMKTESVEVEKEKAEARVRTAEDEKQLGELGKRRAQLRSEIGDSALAHYDRVMRQRRSAVAEARDQKCMACFVMIRPQIWQEVLSNQQIITCSSCGRILFFDPLQQPAQEQLPKKKQTSPAETEPARAQ